MQATSHPNLPPPFPTSNYPSSGLDHKSVGPANGQVMQSHSMMPASSHPQEHSITRGNYQYSLVVEQQPIRARMCGFGDKDRRPITPPPCVKVVIIDTNTGREVGPGEVDSSFFILQVDLWDETATQEKNVVRASSNSPAVSISTATTTSFPPPPERPIYTATSQPVQMYGGAPGYMMQGSAPGQYPPLYSQQQQQQTLPPMYGANAPPGYYAPQNPYGGHPSQVQYQHPPHGDPAYAGNYGQAPMPYQSPPQQGTGMFTRNLIGNLTVNAFTLNDTDEKTGHWFVLQDLSVRTEGTFRLKMNFIDVGIQEGSTKGRTTLNQGKAPVLASVYSQPFQVFSAKKFPGVIESTPLSKCFASQGIKIPIRKDGPKTESRDDDGDD